ncbi:hypothetical protein [Nocardia australiensis]|uniref:hypothetical protein n=1 Tax=Nocardia australiensis TaxID=2887191 RepID=UPI001D13CE79|nr:hypothetical protein [Nocardia australiensis]
MTVEPIAVVSEEVPAEGVRQYRDQRSGCTFFVTTPAVMPTLWDRYLRGALDVYRHFGVECALEFGKVADGGSTSLFFTGVDPAGRLVAGVRMQGPYRDVDDVHALSAWAGRPGEAELRRMVADRVPAGVIEAKGAWVARDAAHRSDLSAVISRTVLHGAKLLGARYGFATVASYTVGRHEASGAVVVEDIPAVPYPDDRYRTVPMWWDTRTYQAYTTEQHSSLVRNEQQMLGIPPTLPSTSERRLGRSENWHRYGR